MAMRWLRLFAGIGGLQLVIVQSLRQNTTRISGYRREELGGMGRDFHAFPQMQTGIVHSEPVTL